MSFGASANWSNAGAGGGYCLPLMLMRSPHQPDGQRHIPLMGPPASAPGLMRPTRPLAADELGLLASQTLWLVALILGGIVIAAAKLHVG